MWARAAIATSIEKIDFTLGFSIMDGRRKNGGARSGAGRKPNNVKYASQIDVANTRIADHLPQLIENLITLADGVTVKEVDDDGVVDIYTKPPDRKANEYLI